MDEAKSKDNVSEAEALEAIERRHTEMLKQTALVSTLTGAVEAGNASAAEFAHDALQALWDG